MSNEILKARIMTVMRNLPPMPQVTQKLLAVMRDENSSANDVTKVLSSDQALAGKVLKLVNSSFYGVPQEITTISRAVVMLGFTGVRNLALGFGSVEALGKLANGLDMQEFWQHAMANAVAAQALAPHANRRTDPEEAFIAGLMHDIGAYVLASAVPDVYAEIMAKARGDQLQLEREATGFTHPQVGQGLIQFWGLPEPFANAARYHHDTKAACEDDQPLTALVALADILACVHGGGFESPASDADLSRLIGAIGLSFDQVRDTLLNMDQKMQDMASFMSISGAARAQASDEKGERRTSCVVATDETREQWVRTVLEHFGHDLVAREDYFNQTGNAAAVDLVLVDPQCLTAQRLERLLKYLDTQSADVVMLVERGVSPPEMVASYPSLGFVFSRRELARALSATRV